MLSPPDQKPSVRESNDFEKRNLFGGALTLKVPSQWRDVSNVRQVPDNQEVYQDCTVESGQALHDVGTGGCIIVELLERQKILDEEAATFFFGDLMEANGGDVTCGIKKGLGFQQVLEVGKSESKESLAIGSKNLTPELSARVMACTCVGTQNIAHKKGEHKLQKASKVRVELCVVRLASVQTDLLITLTMPCAVDGDENENKGHGALFLSILKTLKVEDWSLFS